MGSPPQDWAARLTLPGFSKVMEYSSPKMEETPKATEQKEEPIQWAEKLKKIKNHGNYRVANAPVSEENIF